MYLPIQNIGHSFQGNIQNQIVLSPGVWELREAENSMIFFFYSAKPQQASDSDFCMMNFKNGQIQTSYFII